MLKSIAILTALATAAPALANGPDNCGDLHNQPCPTPQLPFETPIVVGSFSYAQANINGNTAVTGYMATFDGQPIVNVAPYWAFHADQVHKLLGTSPVTLGIAASGVSFALNAVGDSQFYSVDVSGQNTIQGEVSNGLTLTYLIKLTAADSTEAAKIDATLAAGGHAKAAGTYLLDLTGNGQVDVSAATGQFTLGMQDRFAAHCWNTGSFVDFTGCGAHSYNLNVDFTRGDAFQGGSALDYYGDVTISGFLYSNATNFAGHAYIDPVISFGSGFNGINFTAQGGGTPLAISFVPEPAQWALMMGGFGLVGGYARTRRSLKLA